MQTLALRRCWRKIEALRHRLTALETRLPDNPPYEPSQQRSAPRTAVPVAAGAVALEPDATARIARRRALGLGVLASLFAFIGRGAARAADVLTIEQDGVKVDSLEVANTLTARSDLTVAGGLKAGKAVIDNDAGVTGKINFANRLGDRAVLWNPDYTLGIQPSTMYFRASKNFAWYYGGEPDANVELGAGNAKKAMSLSSNELALAGPVKIDGKNALEFGGGITKEQSAGQSPTKSIQGMHWISSVREPKPVNERSRYGLKGARHSTEVLNISGLMVPGGPEVLRMMRGVINADGSKAAGYGFSVKNPVPAFTISNLPRRSRWCPAPPRRKSMGRLPKGTRLQPPRGRHERQCGDHSPQRRPHAGQNRRWWGRRIRSDFLLPRYWAALISWGGDTMSVRELGLSDQSLHCPAEPVPPLAPRAGGCRGAATPIGSGGNWDDGDPGAGQNIDPADRRRGNGTPSRRQK